MLDTSALRRSALVAPEVADAAECAGSSGKGGQGNEGGRQLSGVAEIKLDTGNLCTIHPTRATGDGDGRVRRSGPRRPGSLRSSGNVASHLCGVLGPTLPE